jgi:hypothetical protein
VADLIDKEIEAIKAVLNALEPLGSDVRMNVLSYVIQRLRITLDPTSQISGGAAGSLIENKESEQSGGGQSDSDIHIKTFKEQKRPRSANEMAAVVAYFLAELAPKNERKRTIATKDIETYFKIAEFPLTKVRFTLPNARSAGYLDAVGDGAYKLNAVGHNLVVHSLPRSSSRTSAPRKSRARKAGTAKKRQ